MTLTKNQKEEAIAYLWSKISLNILSEVYAHRDDPDWLVNQHFGLGLAVRNALRHGGFQWDDQTLDNVWPALVVAVAERAMGRQN